MVPEALKVRLVLALAESGDWDAAHKLFSQLPSPKPVVAFNALLSACHSTGAWERALTIHKQMVMEKTKPDAISYALLVGVLEQAGQQQLIHGLLSEATPC